MNPPHEQGTNVAKLRMMIMYAVNIIIRVNPSSSPALRVFSATSKTEISSSAMITPYDTGSAMAVNTGD
jgi:hypothetical protein